MEGFRQRLRDAGLVVRVFTSADGLELEVFHALTDLARHRVAGGGGRCGSRCRRTRRRSPAGSAELERITAAVTDAAGAGGVVAIHAIDGMPGVGKTALAVHAAHLLRDRFPDRQLFIDLHAHTPGQDPVPAGGGAGRAAGRGRGGRPATCPATWRAGRRCGGTGWPGSGRCWSWTTPPAAPRSRRCCPAARSAWCW